MNAAIKLLWLRGQSLSVILVIALCARVTAFLMGLAPTLPDTATYHNAGQALFTSGVIGNHAVMPLYPIISYLTGGGKWLIAVDIMLSVATVAVIYSLAQNLFGDKRASLLAAAIAAIYPYFVFFALSRLTETLFIFLLAAAFLAYYQRQCMIGHFLLVASILTRPTIDLLAPLLVFIFMRFVHRDSVRRSLTQVLGYSLIYFLLMTPWWFHNYCKYGEFVRLNLGYGVVLYAGNNPMNESGGGIYGIDYTNDVVAGIDDPIQRNQKFVNEARDYIQKNPFKFAQNAWRKMLRIWRPWPYAKEFVSVKTVLLSLFSYGIVLISSIICLFRLRRAQIVHLTPVFILILYLTAVHMVTIGSIRYRLPIEPFLIILGSYFLGSRGISSLLVGQANEHT